MLAREKQKLDFVKVTQSQVDIEEINFIKKKTHAIITKIEKGEYYEFTKKSNENNIVENIDITHQKNIHKQIKREFGEYIGLQFESLYKSKSQNPFTNKLYRFKGEFESKKDVEIRLYLSDKKEIMGLNVMSWKNKLFN